MKKRIVTIIGAIVSGKSFSGRFWGTCCGSETVIDELGNDGDVTIYVNSPGGSVFAGFEILNAIKSVIKSGRKVEIYVSPLAASMASYITTAAVGAKVYMTKNAKLMYHAPWVYTWGSKMELRDSADLLESMEDDLKEAISDRGAVVNEEWFATGREKYLSAKEAKRLGLIDGIADVPADVFNSIRDKAAAMKVKWDSMSKTEKAEIEARFRKENNTLQRRELFAAKAELTGYLEHLCSEHYGEKAIVEDVGHESFRVILQNGDSALLKFSQDHLNIAVVDWENSFSNTTSLENGGDEMAVKSKKNDVVDEVNDVDAHGKELDATLDNKSETEADEKDVNAKDEVADEVAGGVTDDNETASNDEDGDVTDEGGDDGADESKSNETNMDEDMLAFAREHYKATRDRYVESIMGCDANIFDKKELDDFSINVLGKIAKLAEFALSVKAEAEKDKKASADNSIVTPKIVSKGTGGSLPPPKY